MNTSFGVFGFIFVPIENEREPNPNGLMYTRRISLHHEYEFGSVKVGRLRFRDDVGNACEHQCSVKPTDITHIIFQT